MSVTDFRKLSREMSGREGAGNSLILITVIVLLVIAGAWAHMTELDNVTRGEGRVVSAMQNQNVQAAEGGVILSRFVSEGDYVGANDILFEIDPIDASAEFNRTSQRFAALQTREIRLRAEIAGTDPVFPADLRARASTVVASEESLFQARRAELAGRLSILQQRMMQREQDLREATVSQETSERTEELLEREIALMEPLVAQSIAPETRLLELRRELERNRGAQQSAAAAMERAHSSIEETLREKENAREEYLRTALAELSTAVGEMAELEEVMPSLQERVGRTVVRAPVEGIVNRLNFRTIGGYVNRGDLLVEMVPTGDILLIEARIAPQDISRIRMDDQVRIRFSAYDSTRYGSVDGRVTRISADAVPDPDNGGSFYVIDVAIVGELIDDRGAEVTFLPGMTATVDVLSGTRTILEYMWNPIARVQELALRD